MFWPLALFPVLLAKSLSQPQNLSPDEETNISIFNPTSSLEILADSSSISPDVPLDGANKPASSSTPLDDTLKILGGLPGSTNQQTQIDAPPEIINPQTPVPHTTFDPIPPEDPGFNQALLDGDSPSFPLLDLLRNIPSNINFPSFGEGSNGEKPSDRDPVEPGEGELPRYDPEERVENPTPPECGEGRFAMCCNQEPAHAASTVPLEQVWQKRRLCRLFGTNWEGCHWRQNIFCCVCKDKRHAAYGCFSPIYIHDPYYTPYGSTERPPPPPEYFERPTVGENVRRPRGREPKVPPPTPPPQPPQSMGQPKIVPSEGEDTGGPFVWKKPDVPGRPKGDGSCTPNQLQYYRDGGTGVFN